MDDEEYTKEEVEQLWRDYYEEKKHYPFGELGENPAPPPYRPKKKGWKVNREDKKEKRIL